MNIFFDFLFFSAAFKILSTHVFTGAKPKGSMEMMGFIAYILCYPSGQPDRFLIHITPHHHIVIPMPVVIQPRFPVMVLPRQPDRLVDALRVVFLQHIAPGVQLCGPGHWPVWSVRAMGVPRWSQWRMAMRACCSFSYFCSFVVLLQIINRMSEDALNRISKRKILKNSLTLRLIHEY